MAYSVVEIQSGARVLTADSLPVKFALPDGGLAQFDAVGDVRPAHAPTHKLMDLVAVNFESPGQFYHQGADVETRDGDVITVTRAWTAWSQAEIDSFNTTKRNNIMIAFETLDNTERASLLVIMDEFNLHAGKLDAVLAAAAGATTLAQFKTAMAAIQGIAQRTKTQMQNAVRTKLNSLNGA